MVITFIWDMMLFILENHQPILQLPLATDKNNIDHPGKNWTDQEICYFIIGKNQKCIYYS